MPKQTNIHQRLKHLSNLDVTNVYRYLSVSKEGLSSMQVNSMRKKYGSNEMNENKKNYITHRFINALINPFSAILIVLAFISFITDVLLQTNFSRNYTTMITIILMIIVSGVIRFIQDTKAKKATVNLHNFMELEVEVVRDGRSTLIPVKELVVGDLVILASGVRIPADLRIVDAKELHISESAMTGESDICKKTSEKNNCQTDLTLLDYPNLAFMSTTVISGKGKGIVVAVGKDTVYGKSSVQENKIGNAYQKGANSISFVLIRFMLIMVSLVFVVTQITNNDLISSFLFALSVAIGLTPELLPLVITTCLAVGSAMLSKKNTIVKNINAMQVFGSMDILCMDKTGTITNDAILMEYYMDILGNECSEVLDLAYLNSYFHSASKNPIDNAILAAQTMPSKEQHFKKLTKHFQKLDEIPFGYDRKYVSVLITDQENKKQLVLKGDIEQILSRCSYIQYRGTLQPIEKDSLTNVWLVVNEMLNEGMKVIAVARKQEFDKIKINTSDEQGLTLLGYIAFFDAPKQTAKQSIESLNHLSVKTKILTGDSLVTAISICNRVGIDSTFVITGSELSELTAEQLYTKVEKNNIFAELTPNQKVKVITALRDNGHTVGFIGDGMNDISALCEADVGISVDTAVETAKDVADVVLLQKDLNVLTDGILEGRKTFVKMLRYIKITSSSNLGNIIAIVCASAFLPFMPMVSMQILLLNLLYDLLCIVLPWDNVEKEELLSPKEWSGKTLPRFMLFFGTISSIFDIITYLFLYFVLCPMLCGGVLFTEITNSAMKLHYIAIFQTGWFLESMWTQVLILHILRTKQLAFWRSGASKPVLWITMLGIISFTLFTFTNTASKIGFTILPIWYFVFLFIIVILYIITTTTAKKIYIKKHKDFI